MPECAECIGGGGGMPEWAHVVEEGGIPEWAECIRGGRDARMCGVY